MALTRKIMGLSLAGILAACGGGGGGTANSTTGGGNASGNSGTTSASSLSESQRLFENFFLSSNGGAWYYTFYISFDDVEKNSRNQIFNSSAIINKATSQSNQSIPASPLNFGAQPLRASLFDGYNEVATTPSIKSGTYLVDGKIVYYEKPQFDSFRYYYSGDNIRKDQLANDNKTVVYSIQLENVSSKELIGSLVNTNAEAMAANPDLLDFLRYKNSQAAYLPGSAYLKFSARQLNDLYTVQDCYQSVVFTVPVNSCPEGDNLQTVLSKGIRKSNITYFMRDGTITSVGGVTMWVSNSPIAPVYEKLVDKIYQTFFELNGKVYMGKLSRAGSKVSMDYYDTYSRAPENGLLVTTTTRLDYIIFFNAAAKNSISNALKKTF
ncbi:hypothetical protein [Undibacterium pigrum]|uniref:Uncharacterized protein n=1 Tax=Undibacterium pigrum TaxID=401470 RepID=A0A318IRV4_9BURK|nr:hypothetical protein [Undibacterium pigrum]PXX37914.1 hypothetical protein DFR42_11474 [Undibacterium pigrum]